MGEVTVYDAERMKAIEDGSVVNGDIVGGHLILTRFDETEIDAGLVAGVSVVTSGTRPATPAVGEHIYESDTKRSYVWNGTAWQYTSGLWICTSGTRPTSPFNGLEIYETDTKRVYVYDGTNWLLTGPNMPHSTVAQVLSGAGTTTSSAFVNFATDVSIAGFVKFRADTKMVFEYMGACYNDDASGLGDFEVGVQFNSVDYLLQDGLGSGPQVGMREVAGIAAGTYTGRLRRRRPSGTGNVREVTGAYNCLKITETF